MPVLCIRGAPAAEAALLVITGTVEVADCARAVPITPKIKNAKTKLMDKNDLIFQGG